jgi:hypothetical protein
MSMFHIFEGETVDFGGTREVISFEILKGVLEYTCR